ncbi:MAG: hypothetical protein ACTSU5_15400 [Promethearchaeota archaeon]
MAGNKNEKKKREAPSELLSRMVRFYESTNENWPDAEVVEVYERARAKNERIREGRRHAVVGE